MELTPPAFLIASPQVEESCFKQTVVLLLEHDHAGATGLIINKPSVLPLQDFVQVERLPIPPHIPAWNGGPQDQTKGIILHNRPSKLEHDNHVFGLSGAETALRRLVRASKKPRHRSELYPHRFLIGCASWQPDQLEEQLQRGDWFQIGVDRHILFDVQAEDIWQHALALLGVSPTKMVSLRQSYLH